MATGDMNLDEARDFFRQAGVNVGGKNVVSLAVASNGPILYAVAVDVNDDVWLWSNAAKETPGQPDWIKLPPVPFMTPVTASSEPEELNT